MPDLSKQFEHLPAPVGSSSDTTHLRHALRVLGFTVARGHGQSRWVLLSDDTSAIVLYADSMERIGRYVWASYQDIVAADVLSCLRPVKGC